MGYHVRLSEAAHTFLTRIDDSLETRITDTLVEVSETKQPTNHSKCTILSNNHSKRLYKVRIGEYRAICDFQKPNLDILTIGHRKKVYNDIDALHERNA